MSAEGKKEITVAGLSKYRIYEVGDSFEIWSKRWNKIKKTHNGNRRRDFSGKHWVVTDDSGKLRNISEGYIRFLLRHKSVSLEIMPTTYNRKIYITKDGLVGNVSDIKRGAPRFSCFESLEDALETVLTLIRMRDTGELCYPVIAHREETAVGIVAKWYGPQQFARDCVDEARELFEKKCRTMFVERIMPLFSLFTMCLKIVAMQRKRNLLELQDGFRRYEDIKANP